MSFMATGHPAIQYDNLITQDCEKVHKYDIYIDGSRINDVENEVQVECAYIVYYEDNEVFFQLFKLSPVCSVFQAELYAIKEAVQ